MSTRARAAAQRACPRAAASTDRRRRRRQKAAATPTALTRLDNPKHASANDGGLLRFLSHRNAPIPRCYTSSTTFPGYRVAPRTQFEVTVAAGHTIALLISPQTAFDRNTVMGTDTALAGAGATVRWASVATYDVTTSSVPIVGPGTTTVGTARYMEGQVDLSNTDGTNATSGQYRACFHGMRLSIEQFCPKLNAGMSVAETITHNGASIPVYMNDATEMVAVASPDELLAAGTPRTTVHYSDNGRFATHIAPNAGAVEYHNGEILLDITGSSQLRRVFGETLTTCLNTPSNLFHPSPHLQETPGVFTHMYHLTPADSSIAFTCKITLDGEYTVAGFAASLLATGSADVAAQPPRALVDIVPADPSVAANQAMVRAAVERSRGTASGVGKFLNGASRAIHTMVETVGISKLGPSLMAKGGQLLERLVRNGVGAAAGLLSDAAPYAIGFV